MFRKLTTYKMCVTIILIHNRRLYNILHYKLYYTEVSSNAHKLVLGRYYFHNIRISILQISIRKLIYDSPL